MIELRRDRVLEPVPESEARVVARRHHTAAHQRELVEDSAGVQAGHEPAGHDRDHDHGEEHDRLRIESRRATVPRPIDQALRRSTRRSRRSATRAKGERRVDTGLTLVRSESPLRTMYQPSTPCAPTSSGSDSIAAEDRLRDPSTSPEKQERERDHQANHSPRESVRPFPPVQRLELWQRYARVHGTGFRDLQVLLERLLPGSWQFIGGMTPVTGLHSVMDRPLSVSRVAPPIAIVAATAMRSRHEPASNRMDSVFVRHRPLAKSLGTVEPG